MNIQAGDLRIQGNNYYVQDKKCFSAYASILDEDKKECFDFAYDMSYAKKRRTQRFKKWWQYA